MDKDLLDWNILMIERRERCFVVKNNIRVPIEGIVKIEVDYIPRIRFYAEQGGERRDTRMPTLIYYLEFGEENKIKLSQMFDFPDCSTISSAYVNFEFDVDYLFPGRIESIPAYLKGYDTPWKREYKTIKMIISIDDSEYVTARTLSNIRRDRKKYLKEELNRFDILDI